MNNLSLPFDQYQRYQAISEIIQSIGLEPGFTLADFGAGVEKLAGRFISGAEITYVDKAFTEDEADKNIQAKNILDMEITKDSFDIVISVDAFEHINAEERPQLLKNLYEAAKSYLILAAPFRTPMVKAFEGISNQNYKILTGENNEWLMEHMEQGLPDLDEVLDFYKQRQCSYAVMGNGNLTRWIKMLNFNLISLSYYNDTEISHALNEAYNAYVYPIDHQEPTYRKIILVSKTKTYAEKIISNLNINHHNESARMGEQAWDTIKAEIDHYMVYKKIANHEEEIKQRKSEIESYKNEIAELRCSGGMDVLTIQEKDNEIFELKQTVLQKKHVINGLNRENEDLNSASIKNNKELIRLTELLSEKKDTIREMEKKIAAQDTCVLQQKEHINRIQCEYDHKHYECDALRKSTSWRITSPIRVVGPISKKIITQTNEVLHLVLRKCYHSGFIPSALKVKIVDFLLRHAPFLFRGNLSAGDIKTKPDSPIKFPNGKATHTDYHEAAKKIRFDDSANPDVSIVLPVYGNVGYTINCLHSIMEMETRYAMEIIVVNDKPSDATIDVIASIPGVKLINNVNNLGFLRSCNAGAELARGEYLVFLNNDTEVIGGWLDELIGPLINNNEIGLVGSKLIYPDGKLQEAGGIIWKDGTGWNYGRFDDPEKPEYNYMREVDYCSGASIALFKELFLSIGGFDERYAPAYFEDADLAFAVREKGKKVVYQPLSQLIHFEGVSCGTDTDSGHKKYQIMNRHKFVDKWKAQLSKHFNPGENVPFARQRNLKKRLLIVDECTPTPDKDAGSVTAYFFMVILSGLGFQITFIPASNYLRMNKYTNDLQRIGIECIYAPYENKVRDHLSEKGDRYDVVLLYRADCANNHVDDVKKYCKNAFIIYDTVDLHYLRLERQAAIENTERIAKEALRYKEMELSVAKKVDATIVLSAAEKEIVSSEMGNNAKIYEIPLILDIPGSRNSFQNRSGIVFIGGFTHLPNVDAVTYFVRNIYPFIKEKIKDMAFYIVGSNAPKSIHALNNHDGVHVLGYVEDLDDVLDTIKLSVVPIRYGAGIKGKIGTSLSYGVPVVSTTVGAEGMGLKNNHDVLIQDKPENFADAVVELYRKHALWERLSKNGLAFVEERYSLAAGRKKLKRLLDSHLQM